MRLQINRLKTLNGSEPLERPTTSNDRLLDFVCLLFETHSKMFFKVLEGFSELR